MGEFAHIFSQSKVDGEADLLLHRIQNGSEPEANQALSELVDRAKRSNDPDDWNAAGLGFNYAGLQDQATHIFDSLVKSYPEKDVYRLNLATSYSQTEQIELCRHHLRYLAAHGSNEEFQRIGREQLEGYERFLGLTEEDQRLRDLQIRSLRRAIGSPERTPDNFIALARLLILRSKLEPEGNWLAESTSVLEEGKEAFPKEPRILELLVAGYLRHDPNGRLPETLALLEKIAPDSTVVEMLATQNKEEANAFSENIYQRANGLMQRAIESKDDHVREAAIQDLGNIVAMYPRNTGYRLLYAFSLMGIGRREAGLEQARHLAETPSESHSFHFNLGQIFWICGDPAQGQHHLGLALRYAENEQEMQDVRDQITELSHQKP